jgi:hypothetical protein
MKKTLTLMMLCISLGCFAQKVNLVLHLKKDSTYYLKTDANMTIVETINGTNQVVSTLISGLVAHKVVAIKDTVYEMDVQFRSLSMHFDIAGKVMDMRSDDATGANPASKIIKSILNKSFTMFISNRGKVLEIKNADAIYQGMFDGFPNITEAQKAQFKAQMQQAFGEKAIRTNFQDAFAVFPAVEVGRGDKWTSNTTLESGAASTIIKTTYVLQDITSDAITIHGDAVIRAGETPALKEFNGIPMRFINPTGTATANTKLDKATGWIVESKVSKSIKGTIQIPDGPKTPGGMTFPMSVTADFTVSDK